MSEFEKFFVTYEDAEKRIKEGIEKYRKGDFTVKLPFGASGKVRVKLKKHKFKFGCNCFMLGEIKDDPSKNAIYEKKIAEVFNMVTLPFYWNATEPREGYTRYKKDAEEMYRRPPIDRCMEFCEKYGIEPREHGLCYDDDFPDWIVGKSEKEVRFYLERRMKEISERYADKIPTIEVTNEMFKPAYKSPLYLRADYVEYCFKEAKKYFPENELVINEMPGYIWNGLGGGNDAYYVYIDRAKERGAEIDAIGMQFHMFMPQEQYYDWTRRYYDESHLFRIMDNYARLAGKLQITEVTVPCYGDRPEDEKLQADILEKLYSIWFSHENMEQIIYWNLIDGYAYNAEPGDMTSGENFYFGGLLRFDMTEKPAYKCIKRLIKEVWTTDETLEIKGGEISFRGYFGEYEITVNGKTYVLKLNESGEFCLDDRRASFQA
ncbi:MAG: endo-1,4-beta-xylanase [Clostridia bacterium]|nr:endo-1,4-beta-xylanase [Clostridia bacterium]